MAEIVDILLRARMEASGIEAGVGQIQKALKGLSLPKGLSEDLEKGFSKLNPLLKEYQKQLNKGFSNKKDLQNFNALRDKINSTFSELQSKVQKANSQNIRLKVDTQEIDKLDKAIASKSNELQKVLNSVFTKQINTSNITSQFDSMVKAMSRATSIKPMTQTAKDLFNAQNYAGYNAQLDKIQSKILSLGKTKIDFAKSLGFKNAEKDIAGAEAKIRSFFNNLRVNEGKVSSIERIRKEIQSLTQESDKLKLESLTRGAEALSKAGSGLGNLKNGLRSVGDDARQAATGILSAKDQVEQLKTSTQYFFSLRNIFSLLKRGIDDAVQSVRDLDKAMTETAVVTDFKVSDMWDMLPEYTDLANKLGATTQGAYETMTLYFQQGLDKQATFEIGEETMKMARIAGLDYAQTTNMMTAALRGFNMELNQTSAKRVNDVYSELAAITASDTRELGLAMERTASIAHSANMDFGNTTAFLAQMIETTREAPENLGTAMKTIIARFQELKQNPYEIAEVEGEEVSFNRIDTALKTIGVDLMDNKDRFRDLDEVFMDIASKWDNLSQTQQRYIATTAAGSRQQSRFLAMVQNYSRLKELTDAAANSEGASQKQFEKTLDSFEAKVNKLKNAWQQFTMGIANNQFVKGAVDGVTSILTATNDLINTLSLGSGVIKSFLSLMTAFVGLKLGGRVINSLVGAMGGIVDPTIGFGAGLKGGFTGNRHAGDAALASQINSPIIAELRAIYNLQAQALNHEIRSDAIARLGKDSSKYDQYKRFQESRAGIKDLSKGSNSVDALIGQLKGLTANNQKVLMRSFSGSFGTATNAILQNYLSKTAPNNKGVFKGLKAGERYLNDQRKAGQITAEQYYKALQNPSMLKQAIENVNMSGKYNAAHQYLEKLNTQVNDEARKMKAQQLWDTHKNLQSTKEGYTRTDAEAQKLIEKYLNPERGRKLSTEEAARQRVLGNVKYEDTKFAKILNGIGNVGSGISSAGMGLQAFGSLLVSSANPAIQMFGTALTSLGGAVSGLGMLVSGISAGFTSIAGSGFMTNIGSMIAGPAKAAAASNVLTGSLMGLVAVVGAGIAIYKKHNENIKKAAEDLTEKYKKNSDEINSNISNLESYKSDYIRLSQGVDQNGMNVSLEDADYQRYLEVVDKIAEINPDIVEGYNAQGHAIIRNNNALEDTLKLEKERQKELVKDYTSDNSIQTLKQARDLQKQTKKITRDNNTAIKGGPSKKVTYLDEKEFAPQAAMRAQAQEAGKIWKQGIRDGWASENLFKDLGINVNDLVSGNDEAVKAFEQYSSQFSSRFTSAMSAAGNDVSAETKENFANIMNEFTDASDEMEELIQPMYEQLSAKMSQSKIYQDIPKEMVTYFNQGLKELVSDANVEDIQKEADTLAKTFASLNSNNEYLDIMTDIGDAQQAYADSLDETAYQLSADTAISRIEALKDSLDLDETTGYGKALTEYLDNQIAQIENFTQEGIITVTEALNTMSDEITAAEGALETFKTTAEGSNYSTAATNMKEIYDTMTDELHSEGKGDQTYWSGAEFIFGRENLKGKTKKKVDEMLKGVEDELQQGQKGFDAFWQHWTSKKDELGKIEGLKLYDDGWLKDIDENVNPQVYEQISQALGRSEEYVTAMLNKGRQFADISFSNLDQVRMAFSTSDTVIKGQENKEGRQNLYIKESALDAELSAAGITDVSKQEETKTKLEEEQGIKVLTEASKMTADTFTDMGIKGKNWQESLIKTFDATGQFTKDEIQDYAKQYAELNGETFNATDFSQDYSDHLKALEDPNSAAQLDALHNIDSTVSRIAQSVESERLEEGHLDNPLAGDAEKTLFGGKGQDTEAQWFASGKNKEGENLSKTEYEQARKGLVDFINQSKDYVDQLKEAKENAETEEERNKIQEEIDAFEQNLIPKAQEYLKSGDKEYAKNDAADKQTKIDAINKGFNDLMGSITPDQINTDQARATLAQLYEAAINQQPLELTEGLGAQMQSLGIDVQKALDEGLVIDPNGLMNKAKTIGKQTADAAEQGAGEGLESSDSSGVKNKGKKTGKGIRDDAEQSTGEGLEGGDNSKVKGAGKKTGKGIRDDAEQSTGEGLEGGGGHGGRRGLIEKGPAKAQEAQESTYTVKTDDKAVDETKGKVDDLSAEVNKGGKYTIDVPGAAKLTKAAQAAKALSGAKDTKTISVKTGKADTSSVSAAKASIGKTTAKIKVGADTSKALSSAESARKKIDSKSATINVSTSVKGKNVDIYVTKHVKEVTSHTGGYITPSGVLYRAKGGNIIIPSFKKKGTDTVPAMLTPGEYVQNRNAVNYFGIDFMRKINHKDLSGALQSLGSAAKGTRYGRLGPKGNGGLTLTGEEGFEIAWLPDESRSMILGANGPQMINLPKNAVVWGHEDAKKIIRQKSIDAGSHKVTSKDYKPGTKTPSKVQTKSSKGKGKDKNDKGKGKNNKNNDKDVKKIIKKVGKISVWWENQARKVEGTQRKVDKLLKDFEKELNQVGKTRESIKSTADKYKTQLNRSIKLNKQSENKAKKELSNLDKKKVNRSISYEVTKKGKKGKTKKETKKGKVNLAGYINYDAANDTYVINQKAIDKAAKKNKSRAQAIKDLAEKEINDRISKRNTARDNIIKAQEALEKLSNDVYETFYQWEKDITEIYILTQKLEVISKKLSISGSQASLEFSKLEAGIGTATDSLPKITQALENERERLLQQAQGSEQKVKLAEQEFIDSMSLDKYAQNYLDNPNSPEAQDDYNAAKLAFDFLKSVNLEGDNFNYNEAIAALNDQQYNKKTNDAIKSILDKIFEKQGNYLGAIEESYKTLSEVYEKMEEYQSFISDFEQDLLSGIEEQAESEIKKLDNLNSSLSKAFKDLIDEVKNRLDERRKKEDNAKTQSDITKKQQRLSALRADTAGGHQVEIAQLEKEIAEAQQSYQRSLEDQLLEKLQEQGDKAEKQRERQISLLETQQEIAKQTGSNLEQVKQWLQNPEKNKEQIKQAWLSNKNYENLPLKEQQQLEEQFESEWAKYLGYTNALAGYEDTETQGTLSSIEGSVNQIANNIVGVNTSKSLKDLNAERVAAGKEKLTAKEARKLGYGAKELHENGYTDQQIKGGGYSIKQFKAYKDAMGVKGAAGAKAAVQAGYSKSEAAKGYGATQGMTTLNMSGAAVQKATGAKPKTLQNIVNKSDTDKAVQKDMAGVKLGTVDVNGKAKGGKVKGAHLNKSGTYAGVNKGSTLYTKGWDTTKGKIKGGKWKPITIDKLTPKLLKSYPIDATDALINAIKTKKVGSKINKQFAALVKAAKLAGKTYKLQNGITASVGGNGKIYYNNGKKGVQIWDPAAGKLALDKYNKAGFIKKAKKKGSSVKREYAQVLKANGVTKYASGGLAEQTGPAWLDGTPSKPELVLNAEDTQNFLALKDVLSKAVDSSKSTSNSYGDTTYEININVDHINNDYDVDRIAERIKKDIVKSAGYRNVTQARNFR